MIEIDYNNDMDRCRVCGLPFVRCTGDMTFKTQDTHFEFEKCGDFRERRLVGNAERFWLCPSCTVKYLRMRESKKNTADLTEWAISVVDALNPRAGEILRKRLSECQNP